MKVVSKKLKEKKLSDVERVKEYSKAYSTAYFIKQDEIPNISLQELRKIVNGKIIFPKKSIFKKAFPEFNFDNSFFIIFTNDDLSELLTQFTFPSYLAAGETANEQVVLNAGIVRNERMAELIGETELRGAKNYLNEDRVVCEEGTAIDAKAAEILRIMGKKMGNSSLEILDVKTGWK